MKTGLVLEGGALCGVFTSGVLDCLLEAGISFPYVIGVSAGAGNALSFVSRQKGRTHHVINPGKDTYYGLHSILMTGRPLDLDKMFFEYPFKQYPFDFRTFFRSGTQCEFVVTQCETGEAEYLSEREDIKRLLLIGKASCSLPLICPMVEMSGRHYLDGSLSDSIPFRRALDKGCGKVVVVRTKRDGENHTDYKKYKLLLNRQYGKFYPQFVNTCLQREIMYKEQVKQLTRLEKEGRAFVIRASRPPIKGFEIHSEKIDEYYEHGKRVMGKRLDELAEFLGKD